MGNQTQEFLNLDLLAHWLPLGVFEVDAKGRCLYKNMTLNLILFGYDYYLLHEDSAIQENHKLSEQVPDDRRWLDWFHLEDQVALSKSWDEVMKSSTTLSCNSFKRLSQECRLNPGFQANKWVNINIHVIMNGRQPRYLGTMEDISGRKALEHSIQRIHKENEEQLEAISAILISVDLDFQVRRWNKVAEATFGLSEDAVQGQSFQMVNPSWDWKQIEWALQECVRSRTPQHVEDLPFFNKEGKEGFLALTLNPILSGPGESNPTGILILGKDLTAQRILKRQLLHAQKLESIGQLAAGIAHEVNTPVQFIHDNVKFLGQCFQAVQPILAQCQEFLRNGCFNANEEQRSRQILQRYEDVEMDYLTEEIPSALEQTLDGIQRVASIVQAMKVFSHPGVEGKIAVDLNEHIRNTVTVSRNEWKYVADLTTEFDLTLPPVTCDPNQINQVILNLIINAAHAIEEKLQAGYETRGKIHIRTLRVGPMVEIQIRDSGVGIPECHRHRIFDPFFTTKDPGKGTGQGLSIAHSIIQTHMGEIAFETKPHKGTTFTIRFPLQVSEESVSRIGH